MTTDTNPFAALAERIARAKADPNNPFAALARAEAVAPAEANPNNPFAALAKAERLAAEAARAEANREGQDQ